MRVRSVARFSPGPALVAAAIVVAGCSTPGAASAPAGSGAAQVVQTAAAGEACTFDKYNGGVDKLDLKAVTVGFAQSEKEANPFRIAETQSIKDEAAKLGIKLLTTNAESDLNKEISDIKSMIDQGPRP